MMESLNSHVIFIEKRNKITLGFDLKMSETDLKHWGKCVDSILINACHACGLLFCILILIQHDLTIVLPNLRFASKNI